MPINFVTGLPRQGKTLFMFMQVMERAKTENRPVYYCNIPEVTLPGWTEISHPDKWMECPNDSIIVVDELQDFWGAASSGARVPEPILELSKHGKRGIDFYFITQDPTLVHNTPRKLTEVHWFVVRAFGTENAIAYKSTGKSCWNTPVSKAEKYPWRYPKEAFGKKDKAGNWITKPWYKSADVHNIKRKIPLKVWAIPLALVIAVGSAWFAISSVLNYGTKMAATAQQSVPGASSGAAADGVARPPARVDSRGVVAGPLTRSQYIAARTERIPGFPQTAPAYDQVTQPVEAPFPAACVKMRDVCKCYTQQATVLHTPGEICEQIVKHGYFVDWRQGGNRGEQGNHSARGDASRSPAPPPAPPVGVQAPRTIPMPDFPAPVPGQITQADLSAALRVRNPAYASPGLTERVQAVPGAVDGAHVN